MITLAAFVVIRTNDKNNNPPSLYQDMSKMSTTSRSKILMVEQDGTIYAKFTFNSVAAVNEWVEDIKTQFDTDVYMDSPKDAFLIVKGVLNSV